MPSSGLAEPVTPSELNASNAITIPAPESRSMPEPMMSTAEPVRAVRISPVVIIGLADLTSAAIAPACGAAADVP